MGIYQLTDRIIDPARYPWGWEGVLWTPESITTALWLDAADSDTITEVSGAVSQWDDKSGNDRHAAQSASGSRPTYTSVKLNSRNVVTFDGTDDWLGCANSIFSDQLSFSWFAVVRRSTTDTIGGLFCERVASNSAAVQFLAVDTTSVLNRPGAASASGNIEQTEYVSLPTTPQIVGSVQAATFGSAFRNGLQVATNTATKAALTFRPLLLGGQYDSEAGSVAWQQFWPGYIAEFVVTMSTMSTSDRQKLEGYLAHKWGLAANLPSDHPYKQHAPRA